MDSSQNETMTFKYLKAPDCKTYFVEGATGGVTPRGNLYLHLYQERTPTPDTITHRLTADGVLGDVESVEVHEGLIREIQCGLVIDPETASQLFLWLGAHLEELQHFAGASRRFEQGADEATVAEEGEV